MVSTAKDLERNIQDIYPLSFTQKGILFHALYDAAFEVYVEQMSYRLIGQFDLSAFQRAWQEAVNRHDILRTSFFWEETSEPMQVVYRNVQPDWEEQDWRHMSPEEQDQEIEVCLERDRRNGFPSLQTPLMRFIVIRLSDHVYHFTWSFHHLLLDGWSSSLILQEIFAFYESFSQGTEVYLDRPRRYRDYIMWLNEQDLSQAEIYWRKNLAGFTVPTELTVAKGISRNGERHGSFGEHVRKLSEDTTKALQKLVRHHQLTLNNVVQGAWALLLSRYSGEEDVVFGAVLSGRSGDLPGMESMVGLFINTLPMRVNIPQQSEMLTWLKDIQSCYMELQQYEYSPLVEVQKWSEAPKDQPLFESVLVYENYPMDPLLQGSLRDLKVEVARFSEQTNYPLNVIVTPGAELRFQILYDTSRFDHETISQMMEHLLTLLGEMAAGGERKICDLPILTERERRQLLVEWNDTATDYPRESGIHPLFEEQVAQGPDRVAIVFKEEQITYRELNERANRLAHRLRHLGVQPGQKVGLGLERSPDMVVGMLAVLKAGCAYVPMDANDPQERLRYMLEDTQVQVVVVKEGALGKFGELEVEPLVLDSLIEEERIENLPHASAAGHLAYIMYTSGSTGKPKGVMVTHQGVVRLVKGTDYVPFTQDEVYLQLAPVTFDAATFEIWAPLLNGGKVVIFPSREVSLEEIGDTIRLHGVTTLFMTTGLFHQMVEHHLEGLRGIRHLLTGGEAVSQLHAKKVLQQLDCQLIDVYGPTENTTYSTCFPIRDESEIQTNIPIGRPLKNNTAYILDRNLQLVPIGVPGELYLGGDGLALGYLNRPELSEETFIDHPFGPGKLYKTGDRVRFRSDGNIEFLGRIDRLVKIRGYRIELGEIEAALFQCPDVSEAIVIEQQDTSGSKRLVAYVSPQADGSIHLSQLRTKLREKLPDYMIPAAFVILKEMPLTPNGKIDRRALPEPDRNRIAVDKPFSAPRTPVEETLAQIWAEVLNLEQIGVHDNFFESGGDSILAIRLIAKAKQKGLSFTPKELFHHLTIAELAKVAKTDVIVEAEQGSIEGNVPLTPIQIWFFEQGLEDAHHFNLSMILEVKEAVDLDVLEQALQRVVRQHDVLRLRFTPSGEGWEQEHFSGTEQVSIHQIDLSDYSESEQSAAFYEIIEELQGSLHVADGPLLRAAHFQLGADKRSRFLIAVHHLVVDGISWQILLEDLQTAYLQLRQGEEIRLPSKTTSFKQWAGQLVEFAHSGDVRNELNYWKKQILEKEDRLPVDGPDGCNKVQNVRSVSVALSEEETLDFMQKVPKAYQTQTQEVLLSALLLAFERWTGKRSAVIDVEGHGREALFEHLDVSRTVGWFTCIYRLRLDMGTAEGLGDVLKSIKEQVRKVPRGGIGFGLLRYLADEDTRRMFRDVGRAEVLFNYLGQFDQVLDGVSLFGIAPESSDSERSARGVRPYLLEINARVFEGQLRVDWNYSEGIHNRSTIERLAGGFIDALRAIGEHCLSSGAGGYTPSDFPEAALDQNDLDALMNDLKEFQV
ncbi:amino acid adenylation domain-containing protein [Paenibacillus sp. SI8]|uniref:amino acid adenylation domain-containing protein n=1 Tax=unclassified Paenibacillus TaxID=185978 RepID=UPI0034669EDA